MAKILKFPNEANLEVQLQNKLDELVEIYENIERGYNLMQVLEDKSEELSKDFDQILMKYSRAIGTENIPLRFIEFASQHLVINVKTGEIKYEPPEEEV